MSTQPKPKQAPRSLRALMSGLIDYAGLFPPASLPMHDAVQNYSRYLEGPHYWALGRFVVPVARLGEFEAELAKVDTQREWQISAIVGTRVVPDLGHILQFNQRNYGRAVIDSLESKCSAADGIGHAREFIDRSYDWFIEVPPSSDSSALIEAIAFSGANAKLRTGGVTEDFFPPVEDVARFISACIAFEVAFKATAGLHHPVRCIRPFTYAADSASGTMHGFLNLFVASAFAKAGIDSELVPAILNETDTAAFKFDDTGLSWCNQRLNLDQVGDSRGRLALSFGSCSFEEPMAYLREMGLL